jgi:hypothetical protein
VTFSDADFCHFSAARPPVLYRTLAKLLLAAHMSACKAAEEVASYVPQNNGVRF